MRWNRFGWATAGMIGIAAMAAVHEADAGTGTFRLTRTTVQEQSNAWRLMMAITLPNAPSIAHPTFRFAFTPTVVYERALVDGEKIVLNKQPAKNPQALLEMMEVDFADADGKIWKQTKFDFSLTRQRGYQAGEYKLQVRGPNGEIGQAVNVTLEGDNPVVDRRSMDFSKKPPADVWDGGAESGIKQL